MKKFLTFLQICLIIIIILSIRKIYNYNANLNETDIIANETKELFQEIDSTENIDNTNEDPILTSQIFLQTLKEKYPDTVAYININNTSIAYPVVQADNNDFYLTHSPNKTYNANGSIFMSYLNSSDFSDDNTVIYGHNVKSGKLFQNLHLLKQQEFYNETNIIELQTMEGPKDYLIFSVYKTNPSYQYKTPNYDTIEDKLAFINEIKGKSLIKMTNIGNQLSLESILTDPNAKLLTLSTCETGGKERLVVHGIELNNDELSNNANIIEEE